MYRSRGGDQSRETAPETQRSTQIQQSMQASGLTIVVRPSWCSKTSSGQTVAHTPLPSQRSKSMEIAIGSLPSPENLGAGGSRGNHGALNRLGRAL